MLELSEMKQELMDRVTTIINKATEYRNSFDTYAYLWVDDRNEFMRQFLLYNHVLTAEEIEAHVEDGVPECPPTLEQFKEQVMPLKPRKLPRRLSPSFRQKIPPLSLDILRRFSVSNFFTLFRMQIDTYEKLYVEVDGFQGMTTFDTWFCVDAKPFKQALLNIIKRWSYMFKQHLIDHVTNR